MNRKIPVSAPVLNGNESRYVQDCIASSWISSNGPYLERFEAAFARFCGVRHAVACCNGTAALHAALRALGTGPGDEILVPTLTFVASANAIVYCGATPVFIDADPETWNLDVARLEERVTPRTRGILVVHLLGNVVDMDPVRDLARRRGLFVLEDAAEAHGGAYRDRRVGALGDAAAFSFYGNKILTTGEGGMVVTDDDDLARRTRMIKGQGQDFDRRYWFPILGYNYRMTNLAAAIGLAQLERADWHLERHRANAAAYRAALAGRPEFRFAVERPGTRHAHWITGVVLDDCVPVSRDAVMARLADAGIETRPFFPPMHRLPIHAAAAGGRSFPVADRLSDRGLMLPSSAALSPEEIATVCDRLLEATARA